MSARHFTAELRTPTGKNLILFPKRIKLRPLVVTAALVLQDVFLIKLLDLSRTAIRNNMQQATFFFSTISEESPVF